MDNVKEFIKDNFVLLIILFTVVIASVIVYVVKSDEKEITYEITENEVDTPSYIEKKYDANTYQNQTIELFDLLSYYYEYYIDLELNNPNEAYELLSDESKNKFNNNLDEYKEYINNIITIDTYNNTLIKYREVEDNVYDIIDSENYQYTIEENAVWDFKITLKAQQ